MLGGARSSIHSQVKADHSGLWGRHATVIAGVALAFAMLGASGAQAQQNCGNASFSANGHTFNVGPLASSPASVASMIASTLATSSTAFLLQSTAFIGSPSNPAPAQQGGGVWTRVVGGEVEVKSQSNSTISSTFPPGSVAGVSCSQTVHENFAGVQLGTDIARLNTNGWNIHAGTTVGYVESRGNVVGGAAQSFDNFANGFTGGLVGGGTFNNVTQIPFVGAYAAATYGGFFIDGLIRTEYYQTSLNGPGINIFSQNLDAHGYSFSGSVGYNWKVPNSNNWFIEPSAGVILSKLYVDPFNYSTAGTPGASTFNGTLALNDIKSEIGRVGVRVGTTIESGKVTWQPFAAVSVWHEFGPNTTSLYQTCSAVGGGGGCVFFGPTNPAVFSAATSTTTFGTYGQYSVGFSAALADTGWLGFGRLDYRKGDNLEGFSATGGVRYQFTPDVLAKMPTKAPVYKAPIVEAVNWTGFYVGGFGSGLLGEASLNYVIGEANPHVGGYRLGGDVGYNYQSGPWVLGVEADLAWTNLNGGTACGPLVDNFTGNPSPMFQMNCNAWAHWLATATGRVGYAWERALFYVKGGGAWMNQQFSVTCNLSPAEQFANGFGVPNQQCANPAGIALSAFAANVTRGGWTAGYGTEFALTRNWSARAEYNYYGFGDVGVTATDGSPLRVGIHFSEVKVGVNYRFDVGPVIAKY
jgi:opacity protein-like surface antigen